MTEVPFGRGLRVVPFSGALAVAVVDLLAPRSSVTPEENPSRSETDEILGGFTWPHPTFVALDSDRVVGYIEGQLDSTCGDREAPALPGRNEPPGGERADCAWIDHIYVDPRSRRARIGANLMVAFARAAESHGCDRIACLPDSSEGLAERLAFFAAVGLRSRASTGGSAVLLGSVRDVLAAAHLLVG